MNDTEITKEIATANVAITELSKVITDYENALKELDSTRREELCYNAINTALIAVETIFNLRIIHMDSLKLTIEDVIDIENLVNE